MQSLAAIQFCPWLSSSTWRLQSGCINICSALMRIGQMAGHRLGFHLNSSLCLLLWLCSTKETCAAQELDTTVFSLNMLIYSNWCSCSVCCWDLGFRFNACLCSTEAATSKLYIQRRCSFSNCWLVVKHLWFIKVCCTMVCFSTCRTLYVCQMCFNDFNHACMNHRAFYPSFQIGNPYHII